jgi:hypothetical protein
MVAGLLTGRLVSLFVGACQMTAFGCLGYYSIPQQE